MRCKVSTLVVASHRQVGEIRGRGLLAGIELVANRKTKQPFQRSLGALGSALPPSLLLSPCLSLFSYDVCEGWVG